MVGRQTESNLIQYWNKNTLSIAANAQMKIYVLNGDAQRLSVRNNITRRGCDTSTSSAENFVWNALSALPCYSETMAIRTFQAPTLSLGKVMQSAVRKDLSPANLRERDWRSYRPVRQWWKGIREGQLRWRLSLLWTQPDGEGRYRRILFWSLNGLTFQPYGVCPIHQL